MAIVRSMMRLWAVRVRAHVQLWIDAIAATVVVVVVVATAVVTCAAMPCAAILYETIRLLFLDIQSWIAHQHQHSLSMTIVVRLIVVVRQYNSSFHSHHHQSVLWNVIDALLAQHEASAVVVHAVSSAIRVRVPSLHSRNRHRSIVDSRICVPLLPVRRFGVQFQSVHLIPEHSVQVRVQWVPVPRESVIDFQSLLLRVHAILRH